VTNDNINIVTCNKASIPDKLKRKKKKNIISLDCDVDSPSQNVEIKLQKFIIPIYHLSDRIKDLLEIACYIYAADRKISRGSKYSVEYHKWSRNIEFIIKVRDFDFWNQDSVKNKLKEALEFMSGDQSYNFVFQSGKIKDQVGLFDTDEFKISLNKPTSVVLFSGGLDSLAGTLERLVLTKEQICLVSHISNQPTIISTQNLIIRYLNDKYNNRCIHHKFYCHLKNGKAIEETQRTRSFLFCSIAFAIAKAYSLNNFNCYENGITSINLPKRQDLINSRASKTTHPKTLGLMEELFTMINEKVFKIEQPFFKNTKTDIVNKIVEYNGGDIINSSISCSVSRNTEQGFTHCGICSQCIDRRLAIFSNGSEEYDEGIYNFDFIRDNIDNNEKDLIFKSSIIDYLRLALKLSKQNLDSFQADFIEEFIELENYIIGNNSIEKLEIFYALCKKHSKQIETAIVNLRNKYDLPFTNNNPSSFFNIISGKEYFKTPVESLIEDIVKKLQHSIPIAFKSKKPENENIFNDYINSVIDSEKYDYDREYPSVRFSTSKITPDHSISDYNLFIESKYLRGKTTQSVITDGIGADIIKYPNDRHVLFIIYDPERSITDDEKFVKDFKIRNNCTVKIIR
jgi:7-cyano-7-deazaguanine synthase in queuosine biosynthesis